MSVPRNLPFFEKESHLLQNSGSGNDIVLDAKEDYGMDESSNSDEID